MDKKKKIWKKVGIAILLLFLIAAVGIGVSCYYFRKSGIFMKNTILNGYDVSGKTPEEVLEDLKSGFDQIQVVLLEKGETDLDASIKDLGFYLEEERTKGIIKEALAMQTDSLLDIALSLFHGLTFQVDVPSSVDEAIFASKVNAETLAVERVASKNARVRVRRNGTYRIVDEVYGTEFDDADLQYKVRTTIGNALSDASSGKSAFTTGKIEVEFPEEIYIAPKILSTNPKLIRRMNAYNQFCKAEITYQFGSQTEVLGWDTVKEWLIIEEDGGRIDTDLAWAYVEDLAARYNTRYHQRTFTTTYGGTYTFSSGQNEYGYIINQDAEFAQLLEDLSANTATSREPVYYKTNSYDNPLYYKREGRDDLAGTYVEINLSAQHLWFYKNGALIIESDLVSGNVSKGHDTAVGVFPLAYKKSPDILVGSNANDGYRTEVQYWMPFYEGQGLHDANWRSSFGGNIYQSNGSHGCVNLPPSAAAVIYQNIEPGMAIVLYK